MKPIILTLSIFIFLCGCTNWKAMYVQTKGDLDECLNAEPTIIEGYITETDTVVKSIRDTIIFNQTEYLNRPPVYEKKRHYAIFRDSVEIWFTVENRIEKNRLIQELKTDSLRYPVRIKTITRTVKEVVREYNKWAPVAIGIISGFVIFIILYGFYFRKK